ncbi:hypothetical protein HORIV_45320 [Vreelandella olivaria]|uniref:Secreted protein n=1 Tax=Vreelandella olivaria TaxID=390919 RepID=A0ABM7GMZ7_9GAMM|nr:hypothetical protein HORIV_45320 [Halomonas olivaria]
MLDGFLARGFLLGFLIQTLIFLLQPLRVVTLKRDTLATVKLQNPACHVIQEVAVVGNRHDGTVIVVKETFQPRHRLCVKVVGRLVKQQHIRAGKQQAAECDTASLTAR